MPEINPTKMEQSVKSDNTSRASSQEPLDDFEFEKKRYNSKVKVNCICPKCGEHHVVAFHWIGRGTPRKYCQACKGGSGG